MFTVAYACITGGLVLKPGVTRRSHSVAASTVGDFLAWGGLWSYSLYLLHPPALELIDQRTHLRLPAPLAADVVLAWLILYLFYCVVEKYWLRRSQRVKISNQRISRPDPTEGARLTA